MQEKWFMTSKTILGIALMLLVTLAPVLGFSFTEDDSAFIQSHVDAILIAGAALWGARGRFKAEDRLFLWPD